MNRVQLLIIDPQNDFSDSKGTLFVGGADRDMKEKLPNFIKRVGPKLKRITTTLDSHQLIHIAHPIFWKDTAGNHPAPFTCITVSDVNSGKWTPTRPSMYKRALDYVKALETSGRYVLCIWPPHCLIGSWGHNVVPELHAELVNWENQNFRQVHYVTKGSNPFTEHYSAIQADVIDPTDPGTQLNTALISALASEADLVAIAGEASSHCVANTVRDITKNFPDPKYAEKLVLLTDAMSPVGPYKKLADDFFDEMKAKGVTLSTTDDFLK